MQMYTNPVYGDYMADPFVLAHAGSYYAYGTAPDRFDGRIFRVLHSTDLVHWQMLGGALEPIGAEAYWAPEVAYADGIFYMYYSAGGPDGTGHQLRVATSASPAGPFIDSGQVLVPDAPFSIDPHPFQDSDGQWYLYYACDFLTLSPEHRVGTGIVVDRMTSMTSLAGSPSVVVRPSHDWHLFALQRTIYGQVFDWYTNEGPAVLKHDGRFYCFFSGGAWERQNYGVSYVAADHPLGPYHAHAGGEPVFRTVPDQVIGPGHNSFVTLPETGEEFIVYHAWDAGMTARLMRIDRVTWDQGTPVLLGPTWTPQPAPGARS
jgi:GH43 family beta-xylosidase